MSHSKETRLVITQSKLLELGSIFAHTSQGSVAINCVNKHLVFPVYNCMSVEVNYSCSCKKKEFICQCISYSRNHRNIACLKTNQVYRFHVKDKNYFSKEIHLPILSLYKSNTGKSDRKS